MKSIFRTTGHKLYTKPKQGTRKISISFIINSDGSVKWYWNTKCRKPMFLKFYSSSTLKSKLFSFWVKLIFALHIQKLIFRRETVYCSTQENPIFDIDRDWAISTGTADSNKALLYTENSFHRITDIENLKKIDSEIRTSASIYFSYFFLV